MSDLAAEIFAAIRFGAQVSRTRSNMVRNLNKPKHWRGIQISERHRATFTLQVKNLKKRQDIFKYARRLSSATNPGRSYYKLNCAETVRLPIADFTNRRTVLLQCETLLLDTIFREWGCDSSGVRENYCLASDGNGISWIELLNSDSTKELHVPNTQNVYSITKSRDCTSASQRPGCGQRACC